MIVHLLRRIRFAWIWALAMLVWRNRVAIMRALRSAVARVRGTAPTAPAALRSTGPAGPV
ncbi:MAG: hypothetical protein ABWZ99_00400 [Ilumatobacteraceae bacterium]